VSEIRRRRDPRVSVWADSVMSDQLFLSVLTVGEIRKGIDRLRPRDSSQADVFDRWLSDLRTRFAARILPVTAEVAECWGTMNAARPLSAIDSLIAATARTHSLTVVTGNEADFQGCGVTLLNPWKS
jgi:hypothetical protein